MNATQPRKSIRPNRLFIDQFGNRFKARTIRELKETHGIPGKVSPMFIDGKDGKTYQVGHVIGRHWFDVYEPMRKQVSR